MKQTTKMITIDNIGTCIVYKNKGTLARHLRLPRETLVNWFRDTNVKRYNDIVIYKADKFVIT